MSDRTTGIPVRAVGYTDVGQRSHNEDAFLVNESAGLMIVADGVGGHQAGEVASELTCKALEREIMAGSSLEEGIQVANAEVFDAVAQELGRAGMASTVVAMHFDGPAWALAWVGDSRAYLWDGQLGLLSRDHSLVESLVQSGQITIEEARNHPKKNVIEQAIGLQVQNNLNIGGNYGELQPGQILLLCSDGLNDVVDSARICEILASDASLEDRCRELVMSAVNDGGRDNTTVVLIEPEDGLQGDPDAKAPDFVWRYDPAGNSYSGLPELNPRPKSTVTRVAPRAPEGGTMIMQSPLAPGGALSEANKQAKADRNKRNIWVGVAVTALLVAGAGLVIIGI